MGKQISSQDEHLILESLKPFIENSSHVKTNLLRIKEVAKWLKDYDFRQQNYDFYPDLNKEDLVQFAFVLNSINFQFRKFQEPWRKFEVEYQSRVYGGFFFRLFNSFQSYFSFCSLSTLKTVYNRLFNIDDKQKKRES